MSGADLVSVVIYLESKGPGVVGNALYWAFFDISLELGCRFAVGQGCCCRGSYVFWACSVEEPHGPGAFGQPALCM